MNAGFTAATLSHGSVFHAFHDDSGKGKFFILLNATWPDHEVHSVLCTSQLDFFADGQLDSQILRIPAGVYPFFPKDTIVDFRRLWSVALTTLCAAQGFSVKGELSAADLKECDHRVRCALQLTGRQKKLLLRD